MITQFDYPEYRRRLAGLSDTAGIESGFADQYRDLSSECVLLFCICYNRRSLKPENIWERIDSAIQKGLAECDGEDVSRFLSTCFEHILASINVTAAQVDAIRIQQQLLGLTDDARVYFLQYMAKHRYTAITLGREKWEARKADIAEQLKSLDAVDNDTDDDAPATVKKPKRATKAPEKSINELFKAEVSE